MGRGAFVLVPSKDVSGDTLKEQEDALHENEPEKRRCQHSAIEAENLWMGDKDIN